MNNPPVFSHHSPFWVRLTAIPYRGQTAPLAIFFLALTFAASGQTELRPSEVGARLDPQTAAPAPNYNLKVGPIDFRVTAGLQTSYNDNITLTQKNPVGDEIITPSVTLEGFWQISTFNSLHLDVTVGYMRYLEHPNLMNSGSGLTISPDSVLEYKAFIGSCVFRLHDHFSFEQDATSEPTLNNVSNPGFFNNDGGLDVTWAASPYLHIQAGYDHTDLLASNSGFDFESYSEDQFTLSSNVQIEPYLAGGLEGSLASTRYHSNDKSDATTFSFGPFIDLKLTSFTHMHLGGGYQGIEFAGNAKSSIALVPGAVNPVVVQGQQVSSPDQRTFYFNFEVVNALTRHINLTLSAGREAALGITSASTTDYYVRYNADWKATTFLGVHSDVFLELGKTAGALNPERFTQAGFDLSADFTITKRLDTSLSYRFIHNSSDLDGNSYTQNVISLSLSYSF